MASISSSVRGLRCLIWSVGIGIGVAAVVPLENLTPALVLALTLALVLVLDRVFGRERAASVYGTRTPFLEGAKFSLGHGLVIGSLLGLSLSLSGHVGWCHCGVRQE